MYFLSVFEVQCTHLTSLVREFRFGCNQLPKTTCDDGYEERAAPKTTFWYDSLLVQTNQQLFYTSFVLRTDLIDWLLHLVLTLNTTRPLPPSHE